jgi:hypothetical protein
MEADAFLERVGAIVARAPQLSALDGAVLASLDAEIAADSRSFAKVFGVAHALVLRAVSELADGFGLVAVTDRDARTQRTKLALTEAGRRLLAGRPDALAA